MLHIKLIIIDGLLAVSGSPNLTLAAWRKTAKGMEMPEVVTEIDAVMELNNRFFAPNWLDMRTDFDPSRLGCSGWQYFVPPPEEPEGC